MGSTIDTGQPVASSSGGCPDPNYESVAKRKFRILVNKFNDALQRPSISKESSIASDAADDASSEVSDSVEMESIDSKSGIPKRRDRGKRFPIFSLNPGIGSVRFAWISSDFL